MGWRSNVKYAVLTSLPGGVSNVILYDKYGTVISEEISETAEDLYNEAIGLGAKAIDKISDVALEVAEAGLELIKGAGLAVLSGAELMFDYTYSKVSPHRVATISVLTAMIVYTTTATIIFKRIKGAN
tara:strand:- start:147 stop:530 length:384 start_codon:yes stop_codon:yes gene_type:complete